MRRHFIYSLAATFITAAVTLGSFTACSNEDIVVVTYTTQAPTYTVSIPASMGEDAETRAVTFDNSTTPPTAVSSFTTTDKIYVYNQTKDAMLTGYLTPSADGKTCNLIGNLTGTIAADDNLVLLYNLSVYNSTPSGCYFRYALQDGTQAGVTDGAKATVTASVDNDQLTTATAHFQNVQSMFRFQFTSNSTPLSVKSVLINSNNKGIALSYYPLKDADKYFCNGRIYANLPSATTAPIYVAMCIDESKSAGDALNFEVVDATGKLYTTTKAAPNSGFVNGKYYYNSSAIDLGDYKLQLVKPTLSRSDGGYDSELADANGIRYFDIYSPSISGAGAATGINMSMSGTSTGYWFLLSSDAGNTVNMSGLTATFDESSDYIFSGKSLTLNISGDNTITCKNYDYCIDASSDLKLSGNGTLTVTANNTTYYGLWADNYDGSNGTPDASALAAPGYTVTRSARTDGPDADSNGNPDYYTWTYTVSRIPTDLSTKSGDYTAQDGDILTGELQGNYKISIADGATVTLAGITINGVSKYDPNTSEPLYKWAGITCLGDATIILKDGTTNNVKGFFAEYPGIQAAHNETGVGDEYTLTIQGTGSLTASSNYHAAGIGGNAADDCGNIRIEGGIITAIGSPDSPGIGAPSGCGTITITGGTITSTGYQDAPGIGALNCGKITITGGTVTATGGENGSGIGCKINGSCTDGIEIGGTATVTATGGNNAAGIGGAYCDEQSHQNVTCGNIIIGGTATVTATGGQFAAGIGCGRGFSNSHKSNCGNITIASTVTRVTATKGNGAMNSIGKSSNNYSTCGTVKFGDQTMYNGSQWKTTPTSGENYGDLHFVISTTTNSNDTWTLTPLIHVQGQGGLQDYNVNQATEL